jgi:outer membrane protein OmpA-like peptidoglycan-associated protein
MSEVSPHIHPNQNVLYFSSNGHMVNFGDYDIFKSYWVKGEWTEPKNIGPLVNGKGSEIYFAIDSKAENLFYSKSHEHETHNLDLYSFPLPMEAQPEAVFRFSGKAIEPTTGEVFQGVVTIIDLDQHVEVAPKHLRDDGSFEFELVSGRRYLLLIEGDNFFDVEEVLKLDENVPMGGDISMGGETHKVITFSSIDFDPSSAKLKPEMENNLHLVVEFLQNNPSYNCRVVGHTDSDGNAEANLALSQERAESIQKYLLDYGQLEPHRVLAVGMGDTSPLIQNASTPEDKKRNRRVEFEIFKGE